MNEKDIRIQANKAAFKGDHELLQGLFEEQGNLLIEPDEMGETLLHCACKGGHIPTIEWLIDKGFDLNAVDRLGGSPFFVAVYTGQKEVVNFLKSRGAKLHVPKANKVVSYFQFAISAVCILIMIFLIIKGNLNAMHIVLLPILMGVSVTGISEGIKGLQGKHTFANS